MDDTAGLIPFPGNLDPMAQEFIPTNPYNLPNHLLPPLLPPQIYHPYHPSSVPYQPSPPLPPPPTLAFDGSVGYPQFTPPPVYVGVEPTVALRCLPPPIMMPSRTLLLSMVPTDVSESTVRRELEVFGPVRAVQMERVREGVVTVHFYDLRHAQAALAEIQEQHMQHQYRMRKHYDAVFVQNSLGLLPPPLPPPARGLLSGRAVWAQFVFPVTSCLPEGNNQGTLVIFNVDNAVSSGCLREVFEKFGPVKELRETPLKRHQRFVEFYDTRDAARALKEMNGQEIFGKTVVIEFSRPGGGHNRKSHKPTQISNGNFYSSNDSSRRTSHCYSSSSSPPPPPSPSSLLSSSRRITGHSPRSVSSRESYTSQPHIHTKKSTFFSKGNPSSRDGSKGFCIGSSVESSLASISIQENEIENGVEELSNSRQIPKKNSKKSNNSSSSTKAQQHYQTQQLQNNSFKGSGKHWKSSKHVKDHDPRFLINEDAIVEANCRETRTTVMIKNIPNKYSQKLLLNMLDNHCIHCNEQIADGEDQPLSSYDFVYLPIDFVNKCNVGYGFVNMTSPQATLRLYKAFHLQSWEVFNSRKICEVTYARLQGIEALKEHFKNSKFPCDSEEYMPVIFSPPRDGRMLAEPVPIVGQCFDAPLSPSVVPSSSDSPAVCSSKEESSENGSSSPFFLETDGWSSNIDRSYCSNNGDDEEVEGEYVIMEGGGRNGSSNGGGDVGNHYDDGAINDYEGRE